MSAWLQGSFFLHLYVFFLYPYNVMQRQNYPYYFLKTLKHTTHTLSSSSLRTPQTYISNISLSFSVHGDFISSHRNREARFAWWWFGGVSDDLVVVRWCLFISSLFFCFFGIVIPQHSPRLSVPKIPGWVYLEVIRIEMHSRSTIS